MHPDDPLDPDTGHCDCGVPAHQKCHDLYGNQPLVPCTKYLCHVLCSAHRHESGTMGYVQWQGTTQYMGDAPDEGGLRAWLRSWWRRTFWSPQRRAQQVWDEMQQRFPVPAPLPKLTLLVNGRTFVPEGTRMVELK